MRPSRIGERAVIRRAEGDQAATHTRGLRWLSFVVVLALSLGVLSCSRETKAAANRAEIPVDPNVFETDRPDLFKTARVTARPMPTTPGWRVSR